MLRTFVSYDLLSIEDLEELNRQEVKESAATLSSLARSSRPAPSDLSSLSVSSFDLSALIDLPSLLLSPRTVDRILLDLPYKIAPATKGNSGT